MTADPVSFPQWKQALWQTGLSAAIKAEFAREIIGFLKYCKDRHAAATTELAKQYLTEREKQAPGRAREALRWFYLEGRRQPARTKEPQNGPPAGPIQTREPGAWPVTPIHRRTLQPPPAASDTGTTPWEADLIRAVRERGFLWRTEQTYREWALRFARFIAPRSPYAAGGEEVAAFLSELAVRGRASPSAQKQALNALVFVMQEALHRDLGQLEFKRAFAKHRLPTVLAVGECKSLFAQMEGTSRLMAELAYGSGLRLMELLRLRIHHVDLERQRLHVFGGKGDRVNGFANAAEEN